MIELNVGNPKLLILDEPSSGLDPIGIRETRQLLESLKSRGMTIFLNLSLHIKTFYYHSYHWHASPKIRD